MKSRIDSKRIIPEKCSDFIGFNIRLKSRSESSVAHGPGRQITSLRDTDTNRDMGNRESRELVEKDNTEFASSFSDMSPSFVETSATPMTQPQNSAVETLPLHSDERTAQKPTPSYRSIKSIPNELRERLIIYFEEALCRRSCGMTMAIVLTHS